MRPNSRVEWDAEDNVSCSSDTFMAGTSHLGR